MVTGISRSCLSGFDADMAKEEVVEVAVKGKAMDEAIEASHKGKEVVVISSSNNGDPNRDYRVPEGYKVRRPIQGMTKGHRLRMASITSHSSSRSRGSQ